MHDNPDLLHGERPGPFCGRRPEERDLRQDDIDLVGAFHGRAGMVIMIPVLLLSVLPLLVTLQTRMLFNEEFSEGCVSAGQEATDRGGTDVKLARNLTGKYSDLARVTLVV